MLLLQCGTGGIYYCTALENTAGDSERRDRISEIKTYVQRFRRQRLQVINLQNSGDSRLLIVLTYARVLRGKNFGLGVTHRGE